MAKTRLPGKVKTFLDLSLRHWPTPGNKFVHMIENTPTLAAILREHLLDKGSSTGFTAAAGNRQHHLNHSSSNAKQFVICAIRMCEDIRHCSDEAPGRIQP
jgi:uncharacterized cupin superfamily protein